MINAERSLPDIIARSAIWHIYNSLSITFYFLNSDHFVWVGKFFSGTDKGVIRFSLQLPQSVSPARNCKVLYYQVSGAGTGPAGPAAAVPIFSQKKRRLSDWMTVCRFCEVCRLGLLSWKIQRIHKRRRDWLDNNSGSSAMLLSNDPEPRRR